MSPCPAGKFLHPSRRPNMIVVVSLLPEQELDLMRGDPSVQRYTCQHQT
jgi:hypothetical protein